MPTRALSGAWTDPIRRLECHGVDLEKRLPDVGKKDF
jgi:hypothetical protein